jgi:hypothetical protein
MVALAMTTMCGFLALAVDVGVAYSVRKSAQAASDAGALAGAANALGTGVYGTCGAIVVCQPAPAACGASGSAPYTTLGSACLYASRNGFSSGGNNGSQTVSVASDINASPNAPGVAANYWVMVEVSEEIPRFFGGVLNSPLLFVRTTSVAAVVQVAGATTVALVQ